MGGDSQKIQIFWTWDLVICETGNCIRVTDVRSFSSTKTDRGYLYGDSSLHEMFLYINNNIYINLCSELTITTVSFR